MEVLELHSLLYIVWYNWKTKLQRITEKEFEEHLILDHSEILVQVRRSSVLRLN